MSQNQENQTLEEVVIPDDDSSVVSESEQEQERESKIFQENNILNRNWILWYHDPNNMDYSLSSYINLGLIKSIEGFWHYYNQLKHIQLQNGMFFLMLEGVLPTWEDTINGGFWSYKIDKKDIVQAWTKLSIFMLSDNFVDVNENGDKLDNEIIGISISPKKTFTILKVWLNNDSLKEQVKINTEIPFIKNEEPIYRSHLETKKKEEQIRNNAS
jgi:hypothetical protein